LLVLTCLNEKCKKQSTRKHNQDLQPMNLDVEHKESEEEIKAPIPSFSDTKIKFHKTE
jgi:hypothetical protein